MLRLLPVRTPAVRSSARIAILRRSRMWSTESTPCDVLPGTRRSYAHSPPRTEETTRVIRAVRDSMITTAIGVVVCGLLSYDICVLGAHYSHSICWRDRVYGLVPGESTMEGTWCIRHPALGQVAHQGLPSRLRKPSPPVMIPRLRSSSALFINLERRREKEVMETAHGTSTVLQVGRSICDAMSRI